MSHLNKMLLWRQSPSSTNTSIADGGCCERGNGCQDYADKAIKGLIILYLNYHRRRNRHNYCQTHVLKIWKYVRTFTTESFLYFTRGEVSELMSCCHRIKDHSTGPQAGHGHLKRHGHSPIYVNILSFCKILLKRK